MTFLLLEKYPEIDISSIIKRPESFKYEIKNN